MSLLKSPLLLLGILLIALTGAAFIVPQTIDWNKYKGQFESYGQRLTGRQVSISGNITVRLFPRPFMKLEKVAIANLPDASSESFIAVDEVRLQLAPGPLLSGDLRFEAITLERPVIALEHLPDIGNSWALHPTLDDSQLLASAHIAIANVNISNGTVLLGNQETATLQPLQGLDAHISAPNLAGPWRLTGTANYRNALMDISLATGRYRANEPLKLSARFAPDDDEGMAMSFDGETIPNSTAQIKGTLRIGPSTTKRKMASAETGLRPLSLHADITADFNHISLRELDISPHDNAETGNRLTGRADLDFTGAMHLKMDLQATTIKLNSILGLEARKELNSMPLVSGLTYLINTLPDNSQVIARTTIASVITDSGTFVDNHLAFTIGNGRMKIDRFASRLPTSASVDFTGLMVADDKLPQLSGTVNFNTANGRDFALWAWPQFTEKINHVWTGARGRINLTGTLDMSPLSSRLSAATLTLDDMPAVFELTDSHSEKQGLTIRFKTDKLNLDRYSSAPIKLLDNTDGTPTTTAFDLLDLLLENGRTNLDFSATEMIANGLRLKDASLDISASEEAIEISKLHFAGLAGGLLDVKAGVQFLEHAITGSMSGVIKAPRPGELLTALGVPLTGNLAYLNTIPELDLGVRLDANNEADKTIINGDLKGHIGTAELTGKMVFDGNLQDWQNAQIKLDFSSHAANDLAALLLRPTPTASTTPLSANLQASGQLAKGFLTTLSAEMAGANMQFSGTAGWQNGQFYGTGRSALLVERVSDFLSKLNLPPLNTAESTPRIIALEGDVVYQDHMLKFDKLSGTLAGSAFSGQLALNKLNNRYQLSGSISNGDLSLPWLMSLFLLRHNDATNRFATDKLPLSLAVLTLNTTRMEMLPGLITGPGLVVIDGDRKNFTLTATSQLTDQRKVAIDMASKADIAGRRFTGTADFSTHTGTLLRTEADQPIIDGELLLKLKFDGLGLSPAAVLANLSGTGSYKLLKPRLINFDPPGFTNQLATADNDAKIDNIITRHLLKNSFAFDNASGTVKIAAGQIELSPIIINTPPLSTTMAANYELADANAELRLQMAVEKPLDMPGFSVRYTGYPSAMRRYDEFSAFQSRLSMKLMEKNLEQLKKLQAEQQRLLDEEAAFRAEQQRKAQQIEEQRQRNLIRQQQELQRQQQEQQAKENAAKKAAEQQRQKLQKSIDDKANAARNAAPQNAPTSIEVAPLPALE